MLVKHRTNWDGVRGAVRSCTWSTISRSAEPLVAIDRSIRVVIGRYVPTTVLRFRFGDKQWFDDSCRRAYDAKETDYRAWCRARNAEDWGQFMLALAKAQRVYRVAKVTNHLTNNTLKHSTCSH